MAFVEALLGTDLDPAAYPLLARAQAELRRAATAREASPVADTLARLATGRPLAEDAAEPLFRALIGGALPEAQAGALLVALEPAALSPATLAVFARVLREAAVPVRPRLPAGAVLADTCGTGSDALGTFNVSTTIAFVLAAAGVCVAKHGNRAITSRCGSADVLEALGVVIDLDARAVETCLERVGIGFMFAPVFHGGLRSVQALRRRLAAETPPALRRPSVFNVLGPLANPAGVPRQMIGVYDATLVPRLAEVVRHLGLERALVAHGRVGDAAGGLDEFSTAGETRYAELRGGQIVEGSLAPEDVGLARATDPAAFAGGDAAASAVIVRDLLAGRDCGPRLDLALLNAAAALYVCDVTPTIAAGVARARQLIADRHALHKLEELRQLSASLRK